MNATNALVRPKSQAVYQALCEVIPGGVNSPVRACPQMGMTPLVVDRAYGDTIYDVDGNEYIDFCSSWGAIIHGHAHAPIVQAAIDRLKKGSSFGATTAIEEELARKVCRLVPSCEKVRFVSSGTEATMSAVRLARGVTGRSHVVTFAGCYHGHADYFLVQAGSGVAHLPDSSSAGIPKEFLQCTFSLPYNDCEAFEALIKEKGELIACVILEPIAANMGVVPGAKEFLQLLRKRTEEIGALLIFDEVITGFRVAKGGAQELYQITADLSTFGKVVGGGFPAACFGGSHEIMNYLAPLGPVYQAGTLSGSPVAMQAGLVALCLLEEPGFYERLNAKAEIITRPVDELLKKKQSMACIQQVGSLFTPFLGCTSVSNMQEAKKTDAAQFKKLFCYLFERGVYVPPSQYEAWMITDAHTEKHLEYVRDLLLNFLKG